MLFVLFVRFDLRLVFWVFEFVVWWFRICSEVGVLIIRWFCLKLIIWIFLFRVSGLGYFVGLLCIALFMFEI